MRWYTYAFVVLALLAFSGTYINSRRHDGHGMAYSMLMLAVWSALAYFTAA
jgi:hypothetical protein